MRGFVGGDVLEPSLELEFDCFSDSSKEGLFGPGLPVVARHLVVLDILRKLRGILDG